MHRKDSLHQGESRRVASLRDLAARLKHHWCFQSVRQGPHTELCAADNGRSRIMLTNALSSTLIEVFGSSVRPLLRPCDFLLDYQLGDNHPDWHSAASAWLTLSPLSFSPQRKLKVSTKLSSCLCPSDQATLAILLPTEGDCVCPGTEHSRLVRNARRLSHES